MVFPRLKRGFLSMRGGARIADSVASRIHAESPNIGRYIASLWFGRFPIPTKFLYPTDLNSYLSDLRALRGRLLDCSNNAGAAFCTGAWPIMIIFYGISSVDIGGIAKYFMKLMGCGPRWRASRNIC